MNLIMIIVIALAVIGVTCLLLGKDGAIISTIIGIISGIGGYGAKAAKEELAPSDTKIPIFSVNADTKVVSMTTYSVPAKSPKLEDKVTIDFGQIDSEIIGSIKMMGLEDTPQQQAALALNRAVGARVSGLDEVCQWNVYLMTKAIAAVASLFNIAVPADKAALDKWVYDYVNVGCHPINTAQKVALGWVSRLDGQSKSLARLQQVGLDWNKLAPNFQTAWYIAELGYNPAVQIGITSEDVVV